MVQLRPKGWGWAAIGPFHDLSLPSPTTLTETQEEACPARVCSLRKKLPEVRVHVKVKLKEGGEDFFQDDIAWDITSKHLPEPDAFAATVGHELGLSHVEVTALTHSVTEQLKDMAAAHPESLELHYSYQEQTQQETAEHARRAAEEKALLVAAARQTQGEWFGRGGPSEDKGGEAAGGQAGGPGARAGTEDMAAARGGKSEGARAEEAGRLLHEQRDLQQTAKKAIKSIDVALMKDHLDVALEPVLPLIPLQLHVILEALSREAQRVCLHLAPHTPQGLIQSKQCCHGCKHAQDKLVAYCPRGYQSHALCELHFSRHHQNLSQREGLALFRARGQPRLSVEQKVEGAVKEEMREEAGGSREAARGGKGVEGAADPATGGTGDGGGRGAGDGGEEETARVTLEAIREKLQPSASSLLASSSMKPSDSPVGGVGPLQSLGGLAAALTSSSTTPAGSLHPLCLVCSLQCPCKPCRRQTLRRALDILRRALNLKAGRAATEDGDLLDVLGSHPLALARSGLSVAHSLLEDDVRRGLRGQMEEKALAKSASKTMLKHSVPEALLPPLAPSTAFPPLVLPSLDPSLLQTLLAYLGAIDKAARGVPAPARALPSARLSPDERKAARQAAKLKQRAAARAVRQASRRARHAAQAVTQAAEEAGYPFPPSLQLRDYPAFLTTAMAAANALAASAAGRGGERKKRAEAGAQEGIQEISSLPPSFPPFPTNFDPVAYTSKMAAVVVEVGGHGGERGGGMGLASALRGLASIDAAASAKTLNRKAGEQEGGRNGGERGRQAGREDEDGGGARAGSRKRNKLDFSPTGDSMRVRVRVRKRLATPSWTSPLMMVRLRRQMGGEGGKEGGRGDGGRWECLAPAPEEEEEAARKRKWFGPSLVLPERALYAFEMVTPSEMAAAGLGVLPVVPEGKGEGKDGAGAPGGGTGPDWGAKAVQIKERTPATGFSSGARSPVKGLIGEGVESKGHLPPSLAAGIGKAENFTAPAQSSRKRKHPSAADGKGLGTASSSTSKAAGPGPPLASRPHSALPLPATAADLKAEPGETANCGPGHVNVEVCCICQEETEEEEAPGREGVGVRSALAKEGSRVESGRKKKGRAPNALLLCTHCPRAYHSRCLHLKHLPPDPAIWLCAECRLPEDEPTRALVEELGLEATPERDAKKILQFLLKHELSGAFCEPVEVEKVPDYADYVREAMDLQTIWDRYFGKGGKAVAAAETAGTEGDTVRRRKKTRDPGGAGVTGGSRTEECGESMDESKARKQEGGLDGDGSDGGVRVAGFPLVDFVCDVRRVWFNCGMYNGVGSVYWAIGELLSRCFERNVAQRLMRYLSEGEKRRLEVRTLEMRRQGVQDLQTLEAAGRIPEDYRNGMGLLEKTNRGASLEGGEEGEKKGGLYEGTKSGTQRSQKARAEKGEGSNGKKGKVEDIELQHQRDSPSFVAKQARHGDWSESRAKKRSVRAADTRGPKQRGK